MAKDYGGPAFPCEQHECSDGSWNQTFFPGMTLRHWFAGRALQGILAAWYQTKDGKVIDDDKAGSFARWSYIMADAMIKEGQK